VQCFDFSLNNRHKMMEPTDGAMMAEQTAGPRRLLQIVLQMSGSQSIRLHVYENDSPREIAARFITFMHNMQMLHVTEQHNIGLLREAIENFIQTEL
jgi:hypothetical protein